MAYIPGRKVAQLHQDPLVESIIIFPNHVSDVLRALWCQILNVCKGWMARANKRRTSLAFPGALDANEMPLKMIVKRVRQLHSAEAST
jgi:hypothetical protein